MSQLVVAYDLSLPEEYMLGAFFQFNEDNSAAVPLAMSKCVDIYGSEPQVLQLLDSTSAMCLDPYLVSEVTLGE